MVIQQHSGKYFRRPGEGGGGFGGWAGDVSSAARRHDVTPTNSGYECKV